MAQILIQKLLNDEIRTGDLLLWINDTNYEDEKYKQLFNVCSQKDFVTYFLNILHDQLICDRCTETSQTEKFSGTIEFQEKLQNQEKIKLAESPFLNDSSHHSINTSYTSTPKDKSYIYNNSLDNFSPIRKTNSARRESENSKSNPLCLGDFIVNNKKNFSKKKNYKSYCESTKKTSKRINPTNLNDSLDRNSFKQSGNSFNFENNISHESVLEEEVDRDSLKKEIEKLNVNRNTIGENILVQIKVKSEQQTKKNRKIIANPKLVRFKKELEKVILIYETLLLNGLVFSYIGELHFVISLLFIEYCESDEPDYCVRKENTVTFQEIFRNYHNVTFFASSILERSIFYLKSLDKSTLKYLCGNEQLKVYSPNLIITLDEISEQKEDRLSKLYESDSKQNICFVLDTDNRSNFPSDISFQSFKKQRDMFYEILKIWEDGHMVPGWSFEYSLGRRIRMLLGYHKDTVNFMRLSRLFMDQLLSTCGRNAAEEIFTETSGSLLTSLPNIDRDKFDRLKTRLVTKQSSSSDTAPEFTGYQEFYKEFILFSSNPNFLRHLCDTFISEIIELNDTTFNNLDTESNEYETDFNTKKAFVNCLKSLRILSKFLGFTESLPYKNETSSVSSNLMELQLKMRNRIKPNFDVLTILQRGIMNGNLVLCVPWICKYLSMLDIITLKTNYYINIIEMLISIYRNIGKTEFSLPEYNIYLIKYSLGWLFEQNHFPISIFFERMNFKLEFFPVNGRSANLDNLVIVDQNILYIFCFYLDKIKMLLTSRTTVRDRITVRHITPLTAVESPKEIFRKKLEMQLEEAFFNGHPSSIKKTVDFVAERIASTCVKYLCYNIVPEFKKRFSKELQSKLKSWLKEEESNSKTDVRLQCEQLAKDYFRTLVKLCNDEVDKIIERNLKNAIHSMVPMDFLPQMEDICICASKRICMEKVKQWTSSHIILNILTKDIGNEIVKWSNEDPKIKSKPMFVLPAGGSNNSHSENTETAAHILDKLRDLSLAMLSSSIELKEGTLIEFLSDTYTTLTKRNDVNEAIHLMICQQILDFLFLLVAFRPSVIEKIQNHFFNIWKLRLFNCEELFSNVLCQRNIMLFAQGGNNSESWSTIATLCVSLLKEGLMNCDNFESQCAGFFKSDLDENTLANVSMFLKIFVEKYKKDCNSSKFTYLLEFLSDYCSDL